MSEHYNIQINIQKVTVAPAPTPARGIQQTITGKDREIAQILELKVSADTEIQAYAKAHKLLFANGPDEVLAMHKRAFGEPEA